MSYAIIDIKGIGPLMADKEDKDKDKTEEKKEDKDKDKGDKDKDKGKDKDKPKDEEKLTDAQKQELEKLTGTFTVVTFEREGKKEEAAELKKMKVVQKGADWSFHLDTEITTGKDTVYPDKSPKEINSLYTNGPDRDKICSPSVPGVES